MSTKSEHHRFVYRFRTGDSVIDSRPFVFVVDDDGALVYSTFGDPVALETSLPDADPSAIPQRVRAIVQDTFAALDAWGRGESNSFDTLPRVNTGSDFQQRAWEAMTTLGMGQTMTYKELAEQAGSPGAARAAGSACARNPWFLIVPCHRILPSSAGTARKLGNYGGGTELKEALLRQESKRAAQEQGAARVL